MLTFAEPRPVLASLTEDLCRSIGYHGIADLDWRFDQTDGRHKLLDFNPPGPPQFRLFETDSGVDVRALHLDLTGREAPPGEQIDGSGLRVENLNVPVALAYRSGGGDGRDSGETPLASACNGLRQRGWRSMILCRPSSPPSDPQVRRR